MKTIGRIASEINQAKGFSSIHQEALLTLMRTADWVRNQMNKKLANKSDLTYQQYNVLRILRGAGKEGLPTLQIAERMVEHTPGITRLIDRLIKKGLVIRERCPDDRRQVLCFISESGLTELKSLDAYMDKMDADLLGHLSDKQTQQLIKLLDHARS